MLKSNIQRSNNYREVCVPAGVDTWLSIVDCLELSLWITLEFWIKRQSTNMTHINVVPPSIVSTALEYVAPRPSRNVAESVRDKQNRFSVKKRCISQYAILNCNR